METIEYVSSNGAKFKIRSIATRRDKSDLNILNSESMEVENGKFIRMNFLKSMPWLIERFVVGWSEDNKTNGKDILNALYEQPADANEDTIMVLGSYILNHVKGLVPSEEDAAKKKD